MKLLIGARDKYPGWETLDIEPGPEVDHVGDCRDLSRFADGAVETIYASHVLEHVAFADIAATLRGWHRVLADDGTVMISVPDLNILSQIYLSPQLQGEEKFKVVTMIFGGQSDPHDFHYMGYDLETLAFCLYQAGFRDMARVVDFGLFDDTSVTKFHGVAISLNVTARKAGAD